VKINILCFTKAAFKNLNSSVYFLQKKIEKFLTCRYCICHRFFRLQYKHQKRKSKYRKAVKELNIQGDTGVYYVEFKTVVNHDGHPGAKENEACAKELILKIRAVIRDRKSN
jgi:hypothetical protein